MQRQAREMADVLLREARQLRDGMGWDGDLLWEETLQQWSREAGQLDQQKDDLLHVKLRA